MYFFSRQMVFVDQQHTLHFFSVRFRLDGLFDITDIDKLDEKRCFILILHSDLPFRRKFELNNKKQLSRLAMLAAAEGSFPFDMTDCYVALGLKEQHSYLFAMTKEALASLALFSTSYSSILVCDFNTHAIKQALNEWMDKGALYDFLGKRSLFNPARWLMAGVSLVAGAVFIGAYWAWALHFEKETQYNKEKMIQLSDRAQPLLKKRLVLSHMQAALGAFYELSQMHAPIAVELLGQLLEKIPEGVNIVDIQFMQQQLEISGWGNNIQAEWLDELDIEFKDIIINDLPERDHFILRIEIPE